MNDKNIFKTLSEILQAPCQIDFIKTMNHESVINENDNFVRVYAGDNFVTCNLYELLMLINIWAYNSGCTITTSMCSEGFKYELKSISSDENFFSMTTEEPIATVITILISEIQKQLEVDNA